MYVVKFRSILIAFFVLIFVIVITFAFSFKLFVKAETKQIDGIKVPIIMYHSVLKDTSKCGKYVIPPREFENDLIFLKQNNYTTIVMQDLIDYVYTKKPLPQNPIILTFDDGYYNNYVYVYPLLRKYNDKAVISLVGTYTDLYTNKPDENANYAYLSWNNASEMIQSGLVEFQNHTYNLHSTCKGRSGCKKKKGESIADYVKLLNTDIGGMQKKVQQNLNYTPTTFTYPFGSVSTDSLPIIKDLGFKASLSCAEGVNIIKHDKDQLYMLKRCIRSYHKSVADILKNY